jgi:hypothetical protein
MLKTTGESHHEDRIELVDGYDCDALAILGTCSHEDESRGLRMPGFGRACDRSNHLRHNRAGLATRRWRRRRRDRRLGSLRPCEPCRIARVFAGRWAAEGAGLPAPDFEFTNTPPGLMFAMLLPELEVFTEIYRHRLQLDFDAGERYLATNLIAADADIRAEFRAFVLTGKLAPRPEIDAGAYLAHYMLVLDAVTAQERASVVSVEVFGALVESEGMSVEAPPPASATVHQTFPPPNPTDQEAECWLKQAVKSSRLNKCLKGLYDRTRQVGPPDMDCDDFADAFIRYLQRVMPPGWS